MQRDALWGPHLVQDAKNGGMALASVVIAAWLVRREFLLFVLLDVGGG